MNKTVVYIKGDPGFKPAVIAKLGLAWVNSARDIGEDLVSFSMPVNVSLEACKATIGEDVLSGYNIRFYDDLPDDDLERKEKFIPGRPMRMSIWSNKDSRLTGGKKV